ncbi:MAG: HRDC domain-containing protein [Flavobacteriales bacterium]|nr:HRDC domain-containing protein [Flavobacteriales bacterium]
MTPDTVKERQARSKKKEVVVVQPSSEMADLLTVLKDLRRTIAKEIGKPAYIVFSDASLTDMAEKRPASLYEFRLVNGVGDHKAKLYSERFLAAIAEWQGA